MYLRPQMSPLQPRNLKYNIVGPNSSIFYKNAKLELCKATELNTNIYHSTFFLGASFSTDTVLGTDYILYFFQRGLQLRSPLLLHVLPTREKRALLLLRTVAGGKLLAMNCTVNKRLDSEVCIFLMLPRVSGSVDEGPTRWERILLSPPSASSVNHGWYLFSLSVDQIYKSLCHLFLVLCKVFVSPKSRTQCRNFGNFISKGQSFISV